MRHFILVGIVWSFCSLHLAAGEIEWIDPEPRELEAYEQKFSEPSLKHERITRQVILELELRHFSELEFDDQLAERFLDLLMMSIDPPHSFLLASDVDEILDSSVTDQIREGEIDFAFDWFEQSLEARETCLEYFEEYLDARHDFTVDETYVIDNELRPYPEDEEARRERWRLIAKYQLLREMAKGSDIEEARQTLSERYRHTYLTAFSANDNDAIHSVIMNAICDAFDHQSTFYSWKQLENFNTNNSQRLVGIGASLQTTADGLRVAKLVSGSPSEQDGRLQVGDVIVGVKDDGAEEYHDVVALPLVEAVQLIRGEANTKVKLRVLKPALQKPVVYTLTRKPIQVSQVRGTVLAGGDLPEDSDYKVGYLHLPYFYQDFEAEAKNRKARSATADTQRELERFNSSDVDIVVVDMRNNSGGSLTEAINLTGLFLDQRPVVLAKDRQGSVQSYLPQKATNVWEKPVVLVVDAVTAGACEILAGAIQDYKRGIVVGDSRTNGAGLIKSSVDLGWRMDESDTSKKMGILQVVNSLFYRPSGESIQRNCIRSDVSLPSLTDHYITRSWDYEYSLSGDRVNGAVKDEYPYELSRRELKSLRFNSELRQAKSEWFKNVEEKIDRYLEEKNRTLITLVPDSFEQSKTQSDEKPEYESLPGLPAITATPFVDEVLAITLDYLEQID